MELQTAETRRESATTLSYVRFFNAVPGSPPLDIYLNDKLIASALYYGDFTQYFSAVPGMYKVTTASSKQGPSFFSENWVMVRPNTIDTVSFIPYVKVEEVSIQRISPTTSEDIRLKVVSDTPKTSTPDGACIRFIHFSPNAGAINIEINGQPLVAFLGFDEITNYYCLNSGRIRLQVVDANTKKPLITHPDLNLQSGKLYAGYVIGLRDGVPGMEIVVPLEGASYL